MGWGSILGTIGGLASFAIPGVGPILGSAILSAGSGLGQGIDSMNAEKKAAKQQAAGAAQANTRLDPYNRLGLQSANTLAGLLGMPGINLPPGAGGMAPLTPQQPQKQGINRGVLTTLPQAMKTVMNNRQAQPPRGATLAQMRGPAVSSYGGQV